MSCRTEKIRAPGFLAAVFVLLAPNMVRADEGKRATKQLIQIDQSVHIMSLEFNSPHRESEALADRGVVDAQGLLARNRTDEATTLLLDVIARWPRTRAAHDATFLLGDALFQLRDFLSARTMLEQAIAAWSGTRREQRAVGRLIEIALRTGDFEPVDRYLGLLATVPALALDPSAAYVRAKLAYHRGNLEDATRSFAAIAPASAFAWRARYFIGTIKVKAGDLKGAAAAFEAVVRDPAPDEDAREIQDLARLALGRICYQQERMDCARTHYLAIQRQPKPDSRVVADALYELGFTYVRSKDFGRAQDAFEQLVRIDPAGAHVFEAKLLVGNLQLRRGDLDAARGSFASARDDIAPSHDLLRETIARIEIDPSFLENLVTQSLDEVTLSAFVSPAIRNWVRTDPEVERLLVLSTDLGGTRRGVVEVKNTLQRIEGVLANPDRQTLFPDLTRTRSAVREVSARLFALRGPFISRARQREQPHLLTSDERLLDSNRAERRGIERRLSVRSFSDTPNSGGGDVRGDGSAPGSAIGLNASAPPASRPEPRDPVGSLRVSAWRPSADKTRFETAELPPAKDSLLASGAREPSAAARLRHLSTREQELHQAMRTKMSPSEQAAFDGDLEVLSRTDAVLLQLLALDARIDAEADLRLAAAKDFVAVRRQEVKAAEDRLTVVISDARNLGGDSMRELCTRLADRLYHVVVRADVGLVDVAWAISRRSSAVVHALMAKKNDELDALNAVRTHQEAALSRRFPMRRAWAPGFELPLRPPPLSPSPLSSSASSLSPGPKPADH